MSCWRGKHLSLLESSILVTFNCYLQQISLYETENLDDIIPGVGRLVVVRTPSPEVTKSDAACGSMESLREVRFLASLSDPNICRVLGVCTAEQPPWTVIEYGDMGNLTQYLQFLAEKNEGMRNSNATSFKYVNCHHFPFNFASAKV